MPFLACFSNLLKVSFSNSGWILMSERRTSPWEQLLENKPLNKANRYNQVKWCLNYYKYYPGYNRAEFICPFVTMKQTPRNASQELLSLLKLLSCDPLARLLTAIPSKHWKTSLLQGNFFQSSQGKPNPEIWERESQAFWENSLLNHTLLSKDLEVTVAGVCLLQMMPLPSHCRYKITLLSHLATWKTEDNIYLGKKSLDTGYKCSITNITQLLLECFY